jgi:serine/threonine protein kinase
MSIYSFLEYLGGIFVGWYYSLFHRRVTFTNRNPNGISVNISSSKIIGEGGYSIVYKAKPFAVKKVLLQSEEARKIYDTELAALKDFHHLGIVRLLDYVETWESGIQVGYMLFPFYENGSLRSRLDEVAKGRASRHSLPMILRQFVGICGAIEVLHSHRPSYVHQDIKPEVCS